MFTSRCYSGPCSWLEFSLLYRNLMAANFVLCRVVGGIRNNRVSKCGFLENSYVNALGVLWMIMSR